MGNDEGRLDALPTTVHRPLFGDFKFSLLLCFVHGKHKNESIENLVMGKTQRFRLPVRVENLLSVCRCLPRSRKFPIYHL